MSAAEIKLSQKMMPFIFASFVGLAMFVGWRLRDYRLITAEHGTGYMMGITGGILMLLLLVYPMRKRIKFLQNMGSVKSWFRAHMMLGILGPLFILLHSNFHLGSLNSKVALFSMLIVSGSGVAGRYFYRKIHHGLYGRRADLVQLREDMEAEKGSIGSHLALIEGMEDELFRFSENVLTPSTTLSGSIVRLINVKILAARARHKIKAMARRDVGAHAKRYQWSRARKKQMLRQVERRVSAMLKKAIHVTEFSCYERLFALWHVLHIPLFFIMVTTIIVHIVAVHQY